MEAHIQRKAIHLQDILVEKTTSYLHRDNPESPNLAKSFFNFFFKGHGQTGRERALNYFNNVISRYSDEELLKEVYLDFIGQKKRLGSSRSYKLRLMEGTCDYLNIRMKAEAAAQSYYSALAQAATYGGPLPELNDIRTEILTEHIKGRIDILMSLQRTNNKMYPL